jgi:hypothetical protein
MVTYLFKIENLVLRARSVPPAGFPVKIASFIGVLEEWKFQITKTEVSGFSVQVSVFLFFFPDT